MDSHGTADLTWLEDYLKRHRPAVVGLMAANNETGVLQPWREALQLCRKHEVPFACDAAQWIGKERSAGLGDCDFVTGCAHKFGGPVGVGFIKVPRGFRALLVGGGQEDGRRAGTENVAGVLAMTAAWELREQQLARGEETIRSGWRDNFVSDIEAALPEARVVSARAKRLWNTAAILMPELADCRRRWVVYLDKQGFAVSTGSACASGREKASHVLGAMGYSPSDAGRMVRFSAGWETTQDEWARLAAAVKSGIFLK